MTNDELDKARAEEAWRVCDTQCFKGDFRLPTVIAARLAREGWTPPEPVDLDVLAYREWFQSLTPIGRLNLTMSDAYLAGARIARKQEQEGAKVLVEGIGKMRRCAPYLVGDIARDTLAAYEKGAQ